MHLPPRARPGVMQHSTTNPQLTRCFADIVPSQHLVRPHLRRRTSLCQPMRLWWDVAFCHPLETHTLPIGKLPMCRPRLSLLLSQLLRVRCLPLYRRQSRNQRLSIQPLSRSKQLCDQPLLQATHRGRLSSQSAPWMPRTDRWNRKWWSCGAKHTSRTLTSRIFNIVWGN